MEKRIEKRLHHSMELIYGDNDTFSPGRTRNISSHGVLIHAEYQLFPINREVKIILTIDSEPVSLQGIVCWNSEYTGLEAMIEKQLGIFIPAPPPQYIDYINNLN
ncbi:MAG: PilZ domain-containing protein [Chrysiogenales bacterium]